MAAGIALYVVYRRTGGQAAAQRFTIPAAALQEREAAEYGSILVPVFGEELDDDIVGTAGRLAAEQDEEGEGGAVLEALYVFEIPMSLPIDARVAEERVRKAKRCSRGRRRWARSTRAWRWRRRWCAAARPGQAIVRRPAAAASRRSCSPPRSRPGCAAARSGRARPGP